MSEDRKKKFRPVYLLALLLLLVLGALIYGFAAANNVPGTGAGDGQATISGYDITNVEYVTSGANITGMTMNVDPTVGGGAGPAVTVRVSFDGGTVWHNCSLVTGTQFTCTISPAVSIASAATLRVVALD